MKKNTWPRIKSFVGQIHREMKYYMGCLPTLLDKRCRSSMEDGFLRLRLTYRCNARCKWCGQLLLSKGQQQSVLDRRYLWEYCLPLYGQIKFLLLTGGDPLVSPECYPFAKFISKEYPRVNLLLETNGIGFDEKWRKLACDNLLYVHFSLNASNAEIYENGCWGGVAGRDAYGKARENLRAFHELLKSKGREVFGPSLSMVVNQATSFDVRDFAKLALDSRARYVMYYFDLMEYDAAGERFSHPGPSRYALRELMKMERVLAGKFFVYFRLYHPTKEFGPIQEEVDQIPLDSLREEYRELLELAADRSMDNDHQKRLELQGQAGKKIVTFDEDWYMTVRQTTVGSQTLCAAPFKLLDIYPWEHADCCSWLYPPLINAESYVHNGSISWEKLYNSPIMRNTRKRMLDGHYDRCMKCCPLNPEYNPLDPPHKYGYDRIKNGNL